jgi:hypothetical protein
MKFYKISLMILLAASVNQIAFAFSQHPVAANTCPAENTITRVGSTYNAPGGWTGVVQRNAAKIQAFEMALYKPKDIKFPFKEGELLSCTYKLSNGAHLDLRLPTTANKAYITNAKNWKSAYSGNQYDCSESRLACEFYLSK